MKSVATKAGRQLQVDETTLAGTANFFAAGVASSVTQLISVPVEVIAQRQMVHNSIRKAAEAVAPSVSSSAPVAAGGAPAGGIPRGPIHVSTVVTTQVAAPALNQTTRTHPEAGSSGRKLHSAACSVSSGQSTATIRHRGGASVVEVLGSRGGASSRFIVSTAQSSLQAASMAGGSIGGGPSASQIIRSILREEGIIGFYRGFGASMATFVPSSAVWWGSYGLFQKLTWAAWDSLTLTSSQHPEHPIGTLPSVVEASAMDVVAVQLFSSVLAGFTSAGLTAPLDLIKTRIQVGGIRVK